MPVKETPLRLVRSVDEMPPRPAPLGPDELHHAAQVAQQIGWIALLVAVTSVLLSLPPSVAAVRILWALNALLMALCLSVVYHAWCFARRLRALAGGR